MIHRDNQPWRSRIPAALDWDDGEIPRSRAFGDIYYSPDDGLAESDYVFLQGNRLRERFARVPTDSAAGAFRVGELGFGSGLNFLLTWQCFREHAPAGSRLYYWSCELHPLRRDDLARALRQWPSLATLAQALLAGYPPAVAGQHRCQLDEGRVILDLCWEDAREALPELAEAAPGSIDAWYLDGFAPAANPGMWDDALWAALAVASRDGASFATFSAAGAVRRGLGAAGMQVARRAGFGRKRESLHGQLATRPAATRPTQTPWDLPSRCEARPASALVIGAGLAGCFTALALARRGIEVRVLEQQSVAAGASGNAQGVIHLRLSHRHSALSDFSLLAYLYALREYQRLFSAGSLQAGLDGDLCGCFQMLDGDGVHPELAAALAALPDLAQPMDRRAAAQRLGFQPAADGLWLPGSGWMDPRALCRRLLDHPNITLREGSGETTLAQDGKAWQVRDGDGAIAGADIVVVATGLAAQRNEPLRWLPLRPVRGQTTSLPAAQLAQSPRAAFCHAGYLAPAREGWHCLGATFGPGDRDTTLRAADHRGNLERLAEAVPDWTEGLARVDHEALDGRAGLRCASPDYLPIVGAAPHCASWLESYAILGRDARQVLAARGDYWPGLFVNTAHGSRALTTAPLAGEIIASAACREPPPIARHLLRAVAPGRFLIRHIIRHGDLPCDAD
jgi:tRNA 5-methylaminomethyl-2-thiouridine biosynthesis bifunctional protein